MLLKDWIKEVGVTRVAELTNTCRQTVYQWVNLETVPRVETAYKIVVASSALVSWADIYESYAISKFKIDKRQLRLKL